MEEYDAYFFDLDGTIYLGEDPLPGARQTLMALRGAGKPVRFLSNNPTRTPAQYADKLTGMGIPTKTCDVITTLQTTVWWLRRYQPSATIFAIGEAPLQQALVDAGFRLSDDPSKIDVVIASYDRGFEYWKLQVAFDALWFHHRAILIQTNPDRFCPFPGGRGEPDAASITAAIEACTQVKCSANMGKPSPLLLQSALADLDVAPGRCLMVGDRLATDIRMAMDAGVAAAVVFTGETKPEDVTDEYDGVFKLDGLFRLIGEEPLEDVGGKGGPGGV